jgi:hypothetical protein
MKADAREFFREATLRICGSLDVQTFLYESFLYLRDYLPADRIFLTYYRPEKGEHIVLAGASAEGASLLNLKVKIPLNISAYIARREKETPVKRNPGWISRKGGVSLYPIHGHPAADLGFPALSNSLRTAGTS